MKCEIRDDEYIHIIPETVAEGLALKYLTDRRVDIVRGEWPIVVYTRPEGSDD